MCIQCRTRFNQDQLLRLQSVNRELSLFTGHGRSFYVCKECQTKEATIKHIMGRCKLPQSQKEHVTLLLKETPN